MQEEQKKKKKRTYLDDFKKNREGRYEYQGEHYICEGGEPALRSARRRILGVYAAVIVCALAAGCIPAPGITGVFYVILPYAFGVVAAGSLGWTLCRFGMAGGVLRTYIYEVTVEKIPHRAILTGVLNTAAAVGGIFFILFHRGEGNMLWSALFCVLEAVAGGGAFVVLRMAGKLRWSRKIQEA